MSNGPTLFCGKCGTRIPGDTQYCPRCGARTARDQSVPEVPCRFCQAYTRPDRTFCVSCRRRLIALTQYDVTAGDFLYSGDRDNLEMLQETGPLPYILGGMVSKGREESMRSRLARNGSKVNMQSRLGSIIIGCSETLGLDMIPETFIVPTPELNASTFGRDDSPVLAITSAALDSLDEIEMTALVGHELGHVKSKHMQYHTLAESLGAGASFVAGMAGVGLVAMPIQMLLLAWHRDSEISADRAALLIVDDPNVFRSMMLKIVGYRPHGSDPRGDSSLAEVFQTHPTYGRRLAMVGEFYASREYVQAKEKVRLRARVKKAFVPFCRFCGAAKAIPDFYCKTCGKSQY
jgi:Zn-dependent protease with chaperone function